MYCKVHGDGPNLVACLHGWTGDHTHFDALAGHVPEGWRLAAFDLPGFGRSAAPASWAMADVGRDVAQALNALDFDTLTLLTNCSGAYPALKAVPHLTRQPVHLVLVDAFAYAPKYFKVFTNRSWGHHAYNTTFANPVGRAITNFSLRRQRKQGGITDEFKTTNHEYTLAWLRACVDLGDCTQFADVQLPTTLAWGAGSFGAVRKSLPMWRQIWPHCRQVELHDAGHLAIVDAAAQVAGLVFTGAPQRALV